MAKKRRLGLNVGRRAKLMNRIDMFCNNQYEGKVPQILSCIFGGKRAMTILLDEPSLLDGVRKRRR